MGLVKGVDYSGKSVLLSSFRNEAPFVLEFVVHHKVVGFDEIIVCSNNCTDGTDEILKSLDGIGLITHITCDPQESDSPQNFAYRTARSRLPIDSAEWLMVLDADELLNIHVANGKLMDLIEFQPPDTDICLVNWACFGSSNQISWISDFSSNLFEFRKASASPRNGMVKSITRRPARWREIGNHHLYNSKELDDFLVSFWAGLWQESIASSGLKKGALNFVRSGRDCHELAQINHYATRSRDCFELRRLRGDGASLLSKENLHHIDSYFDNMSSGSHLDRSILRYRRDFEALFDAVLASGDVASAVAEGLRRYGDQIEAYWQRVR